MTCPICNKPTVKDYRPFCSRRCADVDLGRWMTGSYAIPDDSVEGAKAEAEPQTEDDRPLH